MEPINLKEAIAEANGIDFTELYLDPFSPNATPVWVERITKLQDDAGMSDTDLAARVGVHKNTLSSYLKGKKGENGYTEPKVSFIVSVSRVFNVSTDYLLGITNSKEGSTPVSAISRYTGLSDVSIKQLHEDHEARKCMYNSNEMPPHTIDCLIKSGLTIYLSAYLFADEKTVRSDTDEISNIDCIMVRVSKTLSRLRTAIQNDLKKRKGVIQQRENKSKETR